MYGAKKNHATVKEQPLSISASRGESLNHKKIIMKTLLTLSAFAGGLLLIACNKDDNDNLSPDEKILSSKVWKIQSLTTKSTVNPEQDSSIMKDCINAATIHLYTGMSFDLKDNSTAGCDSTVFGFDKGTWSFNETTDSLYLDGTKRDVAMKVSTLADTMVVATYRDNVSPTNNRVKTITLKKK